MNANHPETVKTCSYCSKVLHGRSDQRFCNDTCRNTYNRNKRAAEKIADHENTPEIFRIINHNYELLKSIKSVKEEDTFAWIEDHSVLRKKGFNPRFFTSVYRDKSELWYCVFEYGFTFGEKSMVVRWLPKQAEI